MPRSGRLPQPWNLKRPSSLPVSFRTSVRGVFCWRVRCGQFLKRCSRDWTLYFASSRLVSVIERSLLCPPGIPLCGRWARPPPAWPARRPPIPRRPFTGSGPPELDRHRRLPLPADVSSVQGNVCALGVICFLAEAHTRPATLPLFSLASGDRSAHRARVRSRDIREGGEPRGLWPFRRPLGSRLVIGDDGRLQRSRFRSSRAPQHGYRPSPQRGCLHPQPPWPGRPRGG